MDSQHPASPAHAPYDRQKARRDFLVLTAGAMGAVAVGSAAWPLIDQMNPAADTLALATTEVDVGTLADGQTLTAIWRGKPVFIHRRGSAEIAEIRSEPWQALRDPQSDEERVQPGHDQFLVIIGVCTHLGCIPMGSKVGQPKGDYNGFFCPCHGSHYDASGRIRKGPAPTNLAVPPYSFVGDTVIRIG